MSCNRFDGLDLCTITPPLPLLGFEKLTLCLLIFSLCLFYQVEQIPIRTWRGRQWNQRSPVPKFQWPKKRLLNTSNKVGELRRMSLESPWCHNLQMILVILWYVLTQIQDMFPDISYRTGHAGANSSHSASWRLLGSRELFKRSGM